MRFWSSLFVLVLMAALIPHGARCAEGIAPEQIFQAVLDLNALMGTWEALPEDNPLDEKNKKTQSASQRVLMTLRKDGTCRIFNQDHPTGSDGIWTLEDHDMAITFRDGSKVEFYVYGVKWGFMVTRSPIKDGTDQLWSKIK
jgi:hypothetical protein